jgi:FkbM family methyltransferase
VRVEHCRVRSRLQYAANARPCAASSIEATAMNLIRKTNRLLSTPGMPAAYARFLVHRVLGTSGPFVSAGGSATLGHWAGFSEYWSYTHLDSSREFAFLSRLAAPNKTALDIGANIGLYSLAMTDAGFGKVHAFEPISVTYSRLCANVWRNGAANTIIPHRIAIGKGDSKVSLVYEKGSPATSHLVSTSEAGATIESVDITSLDRFSELSGIDEIDLVKIDVEGMEIEVLLGAEQLLKEQRIKVGLIEVCPRNLERYGVGVADLLEILKRFGYRLAFLDKSGFANVPAELGRLQNTTLDNGVFFPEGSGRWPWDRMRSVRV